MLNYKGKYAECIVYTDSVEESAVQQIHSFLNCPVFEGSKIRIMPDIHAGKGAVIGFTATMTDKIIPATIGVDIGCGMESLKFLGDSEIKFKELDDSIRKRIPSGFSAQEKSLCKNYDLEVFSVAEELKLDLERVSKSLGTLGGGNHFIEIGRAEDNSVWATIHTGSRNYGLRIAEYHQKIAKEKNPFGELSWLEGEDAQRYLRHMKVAQEYADQNRGFIAIALIELMQEQGFNYTGQKVTSVHNYINFKDSVIRKGAISAHKDELVVIPWNMRDGLLIGRGKGNPDWNFSAPHGAGRVMGRGQAKRNLVLEDFQKTMEGIWSSCINASTLDESPMAYKDPTEVEKYLSETVEVIHRIKPIYNFKASE